MGNDTVGARIKKVLSDFSKTRGVSMRRIAREYLGMPPQTLDAMMSRGSERPSATSIGKIAALAGCRVEWLLTGTGDIYAVQPVGPSGTPENAPRGLVRMELTDGSMNLLDYRPKVVYALAGVPAESGDLALVELRSGERLVRKVFPGDVAVFLVAADPRLAPQTVNRKDIKSMWKLWGMEL